MLEQFDMSFCEKVEGNKNLDLKVVENSLQICLYYNKLNIARIYAQTTTLQHYFHLAELPCASVR